MSWPKITKTKHTEITDYGKPRVSRPDWNNIYKGVAHIPDRVNELVQVSRETARLAMSALRKQNSEDFYNNNGAAERELLDVLGAAGRETPEAWIERNFRGHGAAIRRETDPAIPGEPFMSMATAKEIARQAVAVFTVPLTHALEQIALLDEADGHELTEKHAHRAVAIATSTLGKHPSEIDRPKG